MKAKKIAKNIKNREKGKPTVKAFIAKYMLYIYLHFIKDNDADIYKKWAKPIITVLWFIRSIFVWIAAIVFFPFLYYFGMLFEEKFSEIMKNKNIYNLNY